MIYMYANLLCLLVVSLFLAGVLSLEYRRLIMKDKLQSGGKREKKDIFLINGQRLTQCYDVRTSENNELNG